MADHPSVSIILPCLNEGEVLQELVGRLCELHPNAEIIVVDDGSTPPVETKHPVKVIRHPYRIGNGAAVKTGVRNATGDVLVMMDSDGQHNPDDIQRLLDKLTDGNDMVVGARVLSTHASFGRRWANRFYNRLAGSLTGYAIQDLTSGFRAAKAKAFRNFVYLLPNGFSYPTTSTMAFFRCGYSVAYVPIEALPRLGRSNIRIIKDGIKFFVIILRVGTLFSPMRFFLPLSAVLFCVASAYYGYTYLTWQRFTNMSAVLYMSSLLTFLFGIVSEQISALHYRYSEERRRSNDSASNIG